MPNKATYFAPGKLYLAGEYAVTSPEGEAFILPVKKGIKVIVQSRQHSNIINRQYPKESGRFTWISDIHNGYLRLAIETVRQLLLLRKIPWRNFSLTIDSTLVSQSGKYGLGSSGSLTVGVIGALLKFHGIPFDATMLYQLAVIATIHLDGHTSFGDVACSSAGVPIHYRKFSDTFIPLIKTLHIDRLLKMTWEGLKMQPLSHFYPKPLVIYSGTSASSSALVKKVKPHLTISWIHKSNNLIKNFKETGDLKMITAINAHFKLLETLTKTLLFTKGILQIISIAEAHQGYAKFSGAGGGDSVLAFIPSIHQQAFLSAVKKAKYTVLLDII